MGIDGEVVLGQTFAHMAGLPRFQALFLRGALARSFLSVNGSAPRGHHPNLEEKPRVR